jgi:TP901 family phage tail tape measure protein
MAETIKGINVVLGAETTGLSKALSTVNRESKNIQSELKQVERLLKLDPSNTELLAQKQKLLGNAITTTKEKLDKLRQVQEQVNAQFSKGEINEKQFRAFQREIVKTEKDLQGLENQLKSTGRDVETFGSKLQKASGSLTGIGTAVTGTGVAIAAGLGLAVKTAADFEQELSNAKAVSGSTADEMARLKKAAMEMGASTAFTATQASGAITELLKGGLSAEQVLSGGLKSALDLAAAGELQMATAAEFVVKTMGPFKIAAQDTGKIANILAGAANASATGVEEMGMGMAQVAAVAAQMGVSLDDTATALAIFANRGIVGSDAGTSLKTTLMRLVPSTKEATEEFKRLGLMTASGKNKFFDAEGNLKSLADVSGILKEALGGLTAEQQQMAMATIFGTDAIRAASILTDTGSEGFNNMAESIGKIKASDVAAEKLNNFNGAVRRLQGATETAAISLGDALIPSILAISNVIKGAVDKFNALPDSVKRIIAVAAVAAAAFALIAGPLLLIIGFIPSIIAGFTAISGLFAALGGILGGAGAATGALGAAFTVLTGPVGIVIAIIAALVAAGVLIYKNWDKISAKGKELWANIVAIFTGINDKIGQFIQGAINWGRDLVQGMIDGIKERIAAVVNAAVNMANSVSSTIKDILGISSPSKVMEEFGENVAEGMAEGIDKKTKKVQEKVEKMANAIKAAAQNMLGDLANELSLSNARFELQSDLLGINADEVKKLAIEYQKLIAQKENLISKIEVLMAAYETAKEKLGENNEVTKDYAHDLEMAKIELQKMEAAIRKTNSAIDEQNAKVIKGRQEQVKGLQSLLNEIDTIETKYRSDLAAAAVDYQKKIQQVNDKLIEDERRVTEEYRNQFQDRVDSLYNFVGLFDEVGSSDASGQQLLDNLRGQVSAFDDWQENIQELAARGVDEGLIEELKQMGPKAGPEIAALNTLTDEQLVEYVSLWRTKNEEARAEATNQLQQQRIEMQQKLQEIRIMADEQLTAYRMEWEQKNTEIRKNTEEELKKVKEKFEEAAKAGTTYGAALITNFAAGMESRFDVLRSAVEEALSIVGDIDPAVRHSPSLIDRVKSGIKEMLDAYQGFAVNLGSINLTPPSLPQSVTNILANKNTPSISHNYEGSIIHVTVQDGEDLLRTLHRLGVRIP